MKARLPRPYSITWLRIFRVPPFFQVSIYLLSLTQLGDLLLSLTRFFCFVAVCVSAFFMTVTVSAMNEG